MDTFEIPSHKNELNVDSIFSKQEILVNLQEARKNVKNGAAFILDHHEVYFNMIYHYEEVPPDLLQVAYEDLNRAMKLLNENLPLIIKNLSESEDEDGDISTKSHYLKIIKMLTYCYVQIVRNLEAREQEEQSNSSRKKYSKNSQKVWSNVLNHQTVIKNLNTLINIDIKILWDPPIVEELFVNLIFEVVYSFFQNPSIKNKKETLNETWSFLGNLIKNYGQHRVFIIRIVQLLKLNEHLAPILATGFKFLVDNYQCKSIIHDVVKELIEWQNEVNFNDNQGAKNCSLLLVEMAVQMPELMMNELEWLIEGLGPAIPSLRISVLIVISEIIVKLLTRDDLNEDEIKVRDDFLEDLKTHIYDTSPLVRAKVFQQYERLQKEEAIPIFMQHDVLERAIDHLYDQSSIARKCAASLVTTFLTHNPYGCQLTLQVCKNNLKEFEKNHGTLNNVEDEWNKIEDEIKQIAAKSFEEEPETSMELDENEDAIEILRECLKAKDYKKAVKTARSADNLVEEWKSIGESLAVEEKIKMTLILLKNMFKEMNRDNFEDSSQQEKREFLTNTVKFVELIQKAIDVMKELLDTSNVSDLHEATNFFINAYKFRIERSSEGIIAMLRLMKRKEQDRSDAVINAFKTIYLETDATDLKEHAEIVVCRLVEFLSEIPEIYVEDFEEIISSWAASRTLDNMVIDCLWAHFTQKISSGQNFQVSALDLLRMSALKRPTIINKNIPLISGVVLKDCKIEKDLKLVGVACKAFAICGKEPDANSQKPPFRIKPEDDLFQFLIEILAENFVSVECKNYNYALRNAITCIYKLCSRPDFLCEELLNKIRMKLENSIHENKLEDFKYVRICTLTGSIVINHLNFMDNTIYKELKRRQNIREMRENEKKMEKKATNKRKSVINHSMVSEEQPELQSESAEDSDAELILNILENHTVTGSGLLACFAPLIKNICLNPSPTVQGAAITALIRYMLVSSKFCLDNMKFIFVMYEKTPYSEVKCNILYHFADLLTRFPNIVEPWMGKVHQSLNDKCTKVRETTFWVLSKLILNAMIRVQGNIPTMAKCLIDEDPNLVSMAEVFFRKLSSKENMYNVLPDIFSHLVQQISSEDLRKIMKFLFGLMEKHKFMPNIVERFCMKFTTTEDEEHRRNIAYCLTLINYNEKTLKKLQENFKVYKHLLHDVEIYASFELILKECNKQNEMKKTVEMLKLQMEEVFELKEGQKPPAATTKSASKKKANKPKSKKTKARRDSTSSDSEN